MSKHHQLACQQRFSCEFGNEQKWFSTRANICRFLTSNHCFIWCRAMSNRESELEEAPGAPPSWRLRSLGCLACGTFVTMDVLGRSINSSEPTFLAPLPGIEPGPHEGKSYILTIGLQGNGTFVTTDALALYINSSKHTFLQTTARLQARMYGRQPSMDACSPSL